MSQCKKFAPNIFNKTKCSNCFRQKEEHSSEALECNRASRSIARSGYLFVAPDWDFSVPLNRTKRWQRRWFVLYDDGELNYSVDEHPDTIPQGSVDMSKVLEVTGAEQVTGHPHSLALTSPDRVTFVKAASREDARWWAELLAVFPRRHKRNATFPGGRASPSLPQLGRSASPQPPRPRHLSCTGPSPRTNFETPPLKEERESPPKEEIGVRPGWVPEPTENVTIEVIPNAIRNDYLISSGSPPTRDKLRFDDKARARRDWRNERLRDIATALTDRSPESSLALPAESLLHLKKGWLWLKNPQGDSVMRWVVLSGPSLSVYLEQDEQSAPETVVELSTVTSYSEVVTESKFGFEIKWAGPALVLCAVTSGIRSNWLQALKKALVNSPADSPTSPPTPKSSLFSSDDEYRTASEGGRRESLEDWSELPPSPPSNSRVSLSRVKERTRLRPRMGRGQSSRHSTLDSTSTDEIDCVKVTDLQKKLNVSMEEVRNFEEEIARLKKLQAEATIQEKKSKEMLTELNQRNSQAEQKFLKEQRILQRRLIEAENLAKSYEDKCNHLLRDVQTKQRMIVNFQDEIGNSNELFTRLHEENDRLFKRIQELEGISRKNEKNAPIHVDSLTDLTDIDLDIDIDELGTYELKEYCLDLRGRFEKAVLEIRAVKKELRDAHAKCDNLEIQNCALDNSIESINEKSRSEIDLLVMRLEHLTNRLNTAEKQLRSKSREKRRSLSLKGRESCSINKEVEDKVTELEAKILALERNRVKRKHSRRDRSSERSSPIDDKSLRRLRRKSLDSATASEPMRILMRLSTLESQITSANSASMESLNDTTKTKIDDCLQQLALIKTTKRDRHEENITVLEQNLTELKDAMESDKNEVCVINSSAQTVVKQLEQLLREKLHALSEKKRVLSENNALDSHAKLEILAEKIAFENILIARIQEALSVKADCISERLAVKEVHETACLLNSFEMKLTGGAPKQAPQSHHSAEYLTRILAKCLITSINGGACKKLVKLDQSTLKCLESERERIEVLFESYKSTKLPQLAEALAAETLLGKSSEETMNKLQRKARETVNAELIQSEISHVLMRASHIYQSRSDTDHCYFFSFFAAERAALDLWSDSVSDFLYEEINKNITELTDMYQSNLNKLQRQNWRRRLESERSAKIVSGLLHEFADVVAHKALIDARIETFSEKFQEQFCVNADFKDIVANNYKCWECLEPMDIDQSLIEAEFGCMLERFGKECAMMVARPELDEVLGCLNDLSDEVTRLQSLANVRYDSADLVVKSWSDVAAKSKLLRDKLEEVRRSLQNKHFRRPDSVDDSPRPISLGTEYLTQVENLRAAYRCALASCKERHQETDIEQLQHLCERVLLAMEQWHRRTIQEMRESHAQQLEMLRQEKEQALAEETQATLAALDAMRKAHEAEVQREVAKFKQDFARQQRDDIMDLTERLSVKCLEAAALEEQLGSATRQLTHAQQHILQLERNPQLSNLRRTDGVYP